MEGRRPASGRRAPHTTTVSQSIGISGPANSPDYELVFDDSDNIVVPLEDRRGPLCP
jgi:hypothetical protein